jgi:hypothetical protein
MYVPERSALRNSQSADASRNIREHACNTAIILCETNFVINEEHT